MPRKWTTRAVATAAAALAFAGLAMAPADESPMEKLMEKVNAKNTAITKATRTAVAYKKDQKLIAPAAEELIKLAKDARKDTESAKKQKKTQAEWEKLMDDFIKKTEDLAEVAGKPATTQVQAKASHNAVKATCTACHNVFKVDDEK